MCASSGVIFFSSCSINSGSSCSCSQYSRSHWYHNTHQQDALGHEPRAERASDSKGSWKERGDIRACNNTVGTSGRSIREWFWSIGSLVLLIPVLGWGSPACTLLFLHSPRIHPCRISTESPRAEKTHALVHSRAYTYTRACTHSNNFWIVIQKLNNNYSSVSGVLGGRKIKMYFQPILFHVEIKFIFWLL